MPITLENLEKIVRAAGAVAMTYFNDLPNLAVNKKSARDLVTDADVAVENYLKQALYEHCPEYGFWGEESGKPPTKAVVGSSTPLMALIHFPKANISGASVWRWKSTVN